MHRPPPEPSPSTRTDLSLANAATSASSSSSWDCASPTSPSECIDEHNTERGCQQPHGRYYVVFDERIRRERIDVDLMGIPGIEATRVPEKLVQLRELGASIVTADAPDELAAAMEAEFGVPAANMADTLRTFNGTPDPIHELDPPRRRDHAPITQVPFRAIACVSGITYRRWGAQGGRGHARPRRAARRRVRSGRGRRQRLEDVYGGGLGWAAVSGLRAGRPRSLTRRPARHPPRRAASRTTSRRRPGRRHR
jgi:hypothetical protein